MNKINKLALAIIGALAIVSIGLLMIHSGELTIFNPRGLIAEKQRSLMLFTIFLSLFVVIPVFILTFSIAWKYRANNSAARYTPDWDHNSKLEAVWWGIPCAIILVLAVVTWQSSHELDPYKPLASNVKPVTIQVVALPWKWLFIYPEQHIATINYVRFPAGTPINFVITADAPMNSFWIPQLGGQIYAMPGMSTQLHLVSNSPGSFNGSSANLSGKGFAGMKFVAQSLSSADFADWVKSVKSAPTRLDAASYAQLARPSENNDRTTFATVQDGIFDLIINKYMAPMPSPEANLNQKPEYYHE